MRLFASWQTHSSSFGTAPESHYYNTAPKKHGITQEVPLSARTVASIDKVTVQSYDEGDACTIYSESFMTGASSSAPSVAVAKALLAP